MEPQNQSNKPIYKVSPTPPEQPRLRQDFGGQAHKSWFARHILAEVLGIALFGAIAVSAYYYQASNSAPVFVAPTHKAPTLRSGQSDVPSDWKTYTNSQYGFEFKYPGTWNLSTDNEAGTDYKILGRVVNPARAGKVDTDLPIEQFLVSSANSPCEGTNVNMFDKSTTDTGWKPGFGLIDYRDLCVKTVDWPIFISLSAFDLQSRTIMDQILSTFKFTQ